MTEDREKTTPHANPDVRAHTREFGALLRTLRARRSGLLAQVAKASGITEAYLCMLEKGSRWPAARMVPALAAALGADPCELLSALRRSQPVLRLRQADLSEDQRSELHAMLDRWSVGLRCAWCGALASTRDEDGDPCCTRCAAGGEW